MEFEAAENRLIKVYKPEDEDDWSGLVWPGGAKQMPKDHPPCGWNNEFCQRNPLIPIVATICAFLVTASGLFALAVYFKRKR